MKHAIQRLCLLTAITSCSAISLADIVETTTSSALTTYCVPQTQVRGNYENLVIDHNIVIPAVDHFKSGDIFVGARLKSRPDELWLLTGIAWKKINSATDLRNAHYRNFSQLPLVAPVSIFHYPTDISEMAGDLEIWVGYGLGPVTASAEDTFNEMTMSQRYELLWASPLPPTLPVVGLRNPVADLCLETTAVNRVIKTVRVPVGGISSETNASAH